MLVRAAIESRLRAMRDETDPALHWDQGCYGSTRALVVFVGPSPGRPGPGDPKTAGRQPRKKNYQPAYWNESFDGPTHRWGSGFRISFAPLVEAIFDMRYAKAGKLIGIGNLDWMGAPKSVNVQEAFMRRGAPSVLTMIAACSPELVLPMDKKAFWVLQDAMSQAHFRIDACDAGAKFEVRIFNNRNTPRHRDIYCFRATSPKGHELVVIKLPQHPAKMLQADYGTRCGAAVRAAARQIASGQPVDVSVT